jgi:hypothetical protein
MYLNIGVNRGLNRSLNRGLNKCLCINALTEALSSTLPYAFSSFRYYGGCYTAILLYCYTAAVWWNPIRRLLLLEKEKEK